MTTIPGSTQTGNAPASHRTGDRWIVLPVAVLAVLPYLNGLRNDFCFDDIAFIRNNFLITGPRASALALLTAVMHPGLYRPVTMLTYLANARLGESPVGYHVVNIVLHMLVTVLVFRLARVLLNSDVGAAITAALFAVHPVHTEAVTYIVGRAELLAALFSLMAILTLVQATADARRLHSGWLAASLGCVALGVLAKESAFTAIPLCATVYLWVRRKRGVGQMARLMVPYALLALGYLVLRRLVIGSLTLSTPPDLLDNPLAHVPLQPRLETAFVILWQYLAQLTMPLRLSPDYSYNAIPVVASVLDPRFIGAAAVLTLLTVGLLLCVRRAPALVLAAVFLAIPLSLTANILFPIGTIKGERLLYLPSLGWCLACAWAIMRVPERLRARTLALATLVVVGFAVRTWARNRDWQNNFTLFSAAAQVAPNSAKVHCNLAVALDDRGNVDQAMLSYRKALAIYPPFAWAAFGIGRVYEEKGLDNAALDWYEKATQLNGHLTRAHHNLGEIHSRHGDFAAAEAALRTGLESEPTDPRLLVDLALVRLQLGNRADATALLDRAAPYADGAPDVAKELADARRAVEQAGTP